VIGLGRFVGVAASIAGPQRTRARVSRSVISRHLGTLGNNGDIGGHKTNHWATDRLFGFETRDVECGVETCIEGESAWVFVSGAIGADTLQNSTRGLRCS
jgi:hypothetical protein